MLMGAVYKMLRKLCHLFLSPQYYEMSYGLNIEMHKQVRKTALFFFLVVFPLQIVRLVLVYMERVCVCVSHFVCRSCI